ncbi:MAG: hypothetical protein LBK60_03145 [Verrucomicrobiales bacterium]|jgi:hypothetical protein|nr:hypothetical protein [Verrucomicrobiales bacterium]
MDADFKRDAAAALKELRRAGVEVQAAFVWLLTLAIHEPKFRADFERLTGLRFIFSTAPIDRLIDQACGADQHNMEVMDYFAAFVWITVWTRLAPAARKELIGKVKKNGGAT